MANHKDGFAYFLSKKVGKAITDYKMLDDKDKVLVAVSGGKDSLTLLKILEQRRSFVPIVPCQLNKGMITVIKK